MPCKKEFLKVSQNSQENTCVGISFLIKLQVQCNLQSNFIEMRFYVLIKKNTRAGKRKGFHINYEEFQNTKPRQYQKQVSSV